MKTPVASCDTTFWATKGKFGEISYWNENKGGLDKGERIRVDDLAIYPGNELKKYLRNTFNFEYKDLWGHDSAINVQLVNLRYFQEVQGRVNELRERLGVPLE